MPFRLFAKCVSAPVLSALGFQNGFGDMTQNAQMDVFVGSRIFRECGGPVGRSLPIEFKEFARTCGACHYMVVFRADDGSMVEFDFGPAGGDIHVAGTNPFALKFPRLSPHKDQSVQSNNKSVPGEIRECTISELPKDFVYVGSTGLCLDDIRRFNAEQSKDYELHTNDCRHYANNVTNFATGIHCATSFYVRTRLNLMKHDLSLWSLSMIRVFSMLSDVSQWPRVKAAGNTAAAALFAVVGPSLIRRTGIASNPQICRQLTAARIPERIAGRPARRAAVAAIATVAATCEEAPVLKSVMGVGGFINQRTRSFFNAVGSVFASVGRGVASFRVSPARAIAARSAAQPFPIDGYSIVRQVSGNSLSFLAVSLRHSFKNRLSTSANTNQARHAGRSLGYRGRRHQLSVPISI